MSISARSHEENPVVETCGLTAEAFCRTVEAILRSHGVTVQTQTYAELARRYTVVRITSDEALLGTRERLMAIVDEVYGPAKAQLAITVQSW